MAILTQSGFCIFLTVPEREKRSTDILQKQKKGGVKSTGRNMNSADKWAQTAQGERNSLASSEEIAAGAILEFSILVMADELVPAVKEWLSYGKLRGLGQWRNSGKGRFLCEILEERAADIADILE